LTYPFHDRDILVTACGRLCLHRKRINISSVVAGQKLGIKEVDEGSPPLWNTIGIVVVAAFAASPAGGPNVTISAT
jgi:hypothetical protein